MAKLTMSNTLVLVATFGLCMFLGLKHAHDGGSVVDSHKRSEDSEEFEIHYQDIGDKLQNHELWIEGQGQGQESHGRQNGKNLEFGFKNALGDPENLVDSRLRYPDPHKVKVYQRDRNEQIGQRSRSFVSDDSPVSDPHGGQFKFAVYFSDNMVLQREPHRVSVWGYAPLSMVGQKVGVEVSNKLKEYVTMIQRDGDQAKWEVRLDPYFTSGPHDISASLGSQIIWIREVLFGDVWFCAGSNILATPSQSADYIANNWENSDIRTFVVPSGIHDDHDAKVGRWQVPSQYTLTHFSAACWAFGLRLQQRLGRPIGLVQATAPDSKIVSWLPPGFKDNCYGALSYNEESPERSIVFNGMIRPYLKMAVHGILWYHGERDSTIPSLYGCYLRTLISSWDELWDTGMQTSLSPALPRIPWAIVQLGATDIAKGDMAGDLRWAQTAGVGYLPNKIFPNAFLAVTVDITQVAANHSVILDAGTLSKRLLTGALNLVYPIETRQAAGRSTEEGPRPSHVKVKGDTITVVYDLDLEEQALDVRDVSGFEVCCTADFSSNCRWYQSSITSQLITSVTLSNPCSVRQKTSGLRYLWGASPCKRLDCPIYSKDSNQPASPWLWTFSSKDLLT